MKTKIVVTGILIVLAYILNIYMYQWFLPQDNSNLAIQQLKENGSREMLRAQQQLQSNVGFWIWGVAICVILLMWSGDIKNLIKKMSSSDALLLLLPFLLLSVAGCPKPYDKEEFVQVENFETAFVVPLEAATDGQVKFQSVESLRNLQVATKRIQIPHRWKQEARWSWVGKWIGTVTVIKINRTPVTREWTASEKTGSEKNDQAIWVESKDSIGFSTGFTCTAYVREENAATFLYWYPSGSLERVMDNEIRGKIQTVVQAKAADYNMDQLRDIKNDISKAVLTDISSFFEQRGITIQNIGMFGGFTYENKDIQKSIDDVFVAQQQKNVALAMKQAQDDKNKVIVMAAEAEASARIKRAEGEAKGIQLVADAAAKANSNPAFITLKQLENQAKWIDKWQGTLPTHLWTSGNSPACVMVNTDGPMVGAPSGSSK